MTAGPEPKPEAVRRLTSGIASPAHRDILNRCLSGAVTPATALGQLLSETHDPALVRAAVDDVTRRAATVSRATDSLLRDRVDELTQLVVETQLGAESRNSLQDPEATGS